MSKHDNVIGYIEYLDSGGCVRERIPYFDAEEFKTRIYASLHCGEPIIPVVFPENLSQPLTFEKGTIFPWGLRSEKHELLPYEIYQTNLQPVTEPPLEESVQTPSSFSIPTPDLPPMDDSLILGLLAKQTSTRADNADILAYFEKHPDLASRSEFCRTSYKHIYTQLSVGERMAGFIRHDQYLELWEGNYLTKTAQSNLTWDAVSDKIADLIEQGQLLVPIRTTAPKPELEQLTLTPEQSDAVGLSDSQKQQEVIEETAKRKDWKSPTIDASGKYVTEQDITDVLCSGSGFAGGHFRLQEYFSASQLPTEKEQADHLKKEYGIGGCTWKFADGQSGWVRYDGKGLSVQRGFYNDTNSYRRLLRWPEVAKRIRLLVHNDQYLDENNKQGYEKWEAEQQAKRNARQAEIDYAEKTIEDFCEREGLGKPDFSNLTHIDLAYSTTGDGEHEIQVYANFLRNEIVYLVDGSFVDSARFDSTRALAKEGIEDIEFSQFIDDAEAAYEAYQERHKAKPVEKRPLAAGDTVYLENDHPFTVEEIGIFDVHLRDEDFPLIGRAINRAEFARLLAANPKNNALAAPELTNLPDAGEAAEVIEGEVLEPTEEPPSGFGEQVLQAAELIALKEAYLPNNYIPPQDPAPPRTPREKFAANITAIRTLKSIEKRMADGGPHANGEEQEILAQYSGWGGLSDAFEPNKDSWHGEYTELKSLLTEEEYAAARSSTLTAFYTPPAVIDAMYTALRKMGVGAGTILEPSMGVGAFFGQSHSYLYEPTTRLFGVELDSLTGRIARQLYQKANIQITGFEKADLPDSFFDVVIGNVPFGDYSVVDPQYNRLHFKIHDYFIAKSIDKLRTGGIIAFITTSGTLDKKSEEVRKYINARCDFIGAVRLPDSTFKSAGTKAMADIIFLQKRDHILEQDASWLHTTQTEDGLSLNSYFAEHPEMVCGTLKTVSGPYGPTLTCEAFADKPLPNVLQEAMSHLHAEFHFQDIEEQESGAVEASIPAEPDVRNFSFCIRNGKFYYRENAIMREVSLGATSAARMRLLIELRDTTRELIQAQLEDMPDEVITELQAKLNRQYDHYHNKFGLINSRGASLDMRDDSGYFLLCSLENLDSEGNFIGKSDMFSKRTIRAARPAERVETASEALALSVGERAGIDFGYMQQLTGKDKETLIQDLHNHIVTNSVSFIDGRMFRNDFDTYYKGIRKISDELCRENRLSVIETDGKGQGYADWLSGKTGKPTIRSMVRKDVELAMAAADTFDGFIAELQAMGYTVKYGPRVEHMAVRHQSAQRSVRIDRLDARYSESALRDYYRQLRHLPADMRREYKAQHAPEPAQWLPSELAPVGKRMRCRSSLSKPHHRVSGFMACYYRYCALLRKAYHGKATKRCYFLLREDFKKFNRYQQQTHLLWERRLQTLAEVQAHKSDLENQIEQLARQRKVLYRQKQEPERAAREEQIQKLTKQIKALRHEFYICADIEADAAMVQEKLRQAELAAQQERNEVKEDEYKRRSSRPDGARGASVFRGGY